MDLIMLMIRLLRGLTCGKLEMWYLTKLSIDWLNKFKALFIFR